MAISKSPAPLDQMNDHPRLNLQQRLLTIPIGGYLWVRDCDYRIESVGTIASSLRGIDGARFTVKADREHPGHWGALVHRIAMSPGQDT